MDEQSIGYAKRAKQFPASTQVAIVTVLPNIANGAFWGFTTVNEILPHAEELKKDPNIQLRKIGSGDSVVVEVTPDYLLSATSAVDPNLILKSDIDKIVEFSGRAVVDFEKFLISKGKKGFSGLIGVYCINDTPTISYKGIAYPAFRLPISMILQLCNKYKYAVKVEGKWLTPQQAMQAGQKLFESIIMSPTKTGVFLEIHSTASLDEIKKLEAMMKAKK